MIKVYKYVMNLKDIKTYFNYQIGFIYGKLKSHRVYFFPWGIFEDAVKEKRAGGGWGSACGGN